MARIAGIDLPKDKRIEIGLTYIYGIGRKSAKDILAQTGVNPDTRVKDLSDADEPDRSGHQAADRDRLLSRHSPPQGSARARPAQQDQCAHPQGSQEDHCQQEEVRRENQDGNCKGIRRQEGHSPPA